MKALEYIKVSKCSHVTLLIIRKTYPHQKLLFYFYFLFIQNKCCFSIRFHLISVVDFLEWKRDVNRSTNYLDNWIPCFCSSHDISIRTFLGTRREETILSRLRIGHTRLTHDFILKEEPPPKCPCGNHYTIRHILIECTNISRIRKNFYKVNSMKELFEKINPKNVMEFLKRIGLLSRL